MREIKFRAWDKEAKIMYRVFGIDVNHVTPFVDEKYINKVDILAIPPMREQTILMQYTGLKDKNGREIYEGDIYIDKQYRRGKQDKTYWEVAWNDMDYGFNLVTNKEMSFRGEKYREDIHIPLRSITGRKMEHVGNIFENPELMKEIEK